MCFSLPSVQCPAGVGLLRTVFLILTVPWSSRMPATRARGCVVSADFSRATGLVGVEHTHQPQKGSGKMPSLCMPMGFSSAAGAGPVCIPALAQVGDEGMP